MQLTGMILFFGASLLFLVWTYKYFRSARNRCFLTKEERIMHFTIEYTKGISLFIAIAIFAGIAWD